MKFHSVANCEILVSKKGLILQNPEGEWLIKFDDSGISSPHWKTKWH